MAKIAELKRLRTKRFFERWDGFVDVARVKKSEASLVRLIDDLVVLGQKMTEKATRKAVNACVRRFNRMDDGWICTIEREDISEQVERVVELCGFECEEDWLDERDW